MTEYRTIYDGYCEWLQYKTMKICGWWIFKRLRMKWCYVRTDYYDYFDEQWEKWEQQYGYSGGLRNHQRYINSYNTNIARFIKRYPNIEIWLLERAKTVREKRIAAHNYHKQIELQKSVIKMFNQ